MSTLASVVILGSACASSHGGVYDDCSSVTRRVSFSRSKFSVHEIRVPVPCLSCRCPATATDSTAEKNDAVSFDFEHRKNRNRGDSFLKSTSTPKSNVTSSISPVSKEESKQLLHIYGVDKVEGIKANLSLEDDLHTSDKEQRQLEIQSKTVQIPICAQIKDKVPYSTRYTVFKSYNRVWKKGDPLTNDVMPSKSQVLPTSSHERPPLDSVVNGRRGFSDMGVQTQPTNTPLTPPIPIGMSVSSSSDKIYQASKLVWRKGSSVSRTPLVVKPKETTGVQEEGKTTNSQIQKLHCNECDDIGSIRPRYHQSHGGVHKVESGEMGIGPGTPSLPTNLHEMQGKPPQLENQCIIPREKSGVAHKIINNVPSGEVLMGEKKTEDVGVKSYENIRASPAESIGAKPNSTPSNPHTAVFYKPSKSVWRKGDPIKRSPFIVKNILRNGAVEIALERRMGEDIVIASPGRNLVRNGGGDDIRVQTEIGNEGKSNEASFPITSSVESFSDLTQPTYTGDEAQSDEYDGIIKSKERKIKAIQSLGEVLEKLEKLAVEDIGNVGDKEPTQPLEKSRILVGGEIKTPKKSFLDASHRGFDKNGRQEKKPILIDNFAVKISDFDTFSGFDAHGRAKEKKPILIDNFSLHKPMLDPSFSGYVTDSANIDRDDTDEKFVGGNHDENDTGGALSRRSGVFTPRVSKRREGSSRSRPKKHSKTKASLNLGPMKAELIEVGDEGMSVDVLADNLAITESDVFKFLFSKGIKAGGVRHMDKGLVKMICKEHEVEVIDALPSKPEEMVKKKEFLAEDDLDKLENRPPVLTIMGHVDHGKTTLLDYIRKSKVVDSEAGGITQGIGAYTVLIPVDGRSQPCVFLDTPGHEAFAAMRARGARVTDIVIIVVAADDGVCPQTNEAISHAKAAGVPIILAINKIDKNGACPDTAMQQLANLGLMPEVWGGDTPMVQISALRGDNVGELLEIVMLVAELQELKANPYRAAMGTVIEAGLHKSKGPVATFIVQNGTLKKGDVVVCGESFGKVRALFDDGGNRVNEAGPSMPVQVTGLNHVAVAGDEFEVVGSLDIASEKAELHATAKKKENVSINSRGTKATISSLASVTSAGNLPGLDVHQLNIVLKVDVQGSVEAIKQALQALPQDNVCLKFLVQATGDVNSSDIDIAIVSKALVLGFNVKVSSSIRSVAQKRGLKIDVYRVVYDLIDHVRSEMEALLDPIEEQIPIGTAQVLATFNIGSSQVAGCEVTSGRVAKNSLIHVLNKGKLIHIGVLHSLRRIKEVVDEVDAGRECGIGIENFNEWEVGNVIEAFEKKVKRRTLEEAAASMSAALVELGIK